jgi:hypothetical protein
MLFRKKFAWVLIGIGSLQCVGFLLSGHPNLFGDMVKLTFFAGIPLYSGFRILHNDRKARQKAEAEMQHALRSIRERELLQLASLTRGLITTSQIVQSTSMTAAQAEEILHDFIVRRIADVYTARDGHAVYEIHEFSSARELERRHIASALNRA